MVKFPQPVCRSSLAPSPFAHARIRLARDSACGLQCIKTWGRPSTFLADIIKGLDRRQARSILIKKLDMTSGPHESPPYWKYRDALVFSHAVSPARPQCLTGRSAAAAQTNKPTATCIGRVKARVASWSHTDDGSVQSFLVHPASPSLHCSLSACAAACCDTGGNLGCPHVGWHSECVRCAIGAGAREGDRVRAEAPRSPVHRVPCSAR